MKKCRKCLLDQPLSSFNQNKQNKDGLQSLCKGCHSERRKQLRGTPEQKNKSRIYSIKVKYNLDPDEYESMIESGCNSCGSFDGLAIDHDHSCCQGRTTCGKCIRGALCRTCNTMEGMIRKNPESLPGLILYMRKFGIEITTR